MSILSVNTIIPFSNSNIEIESGSIQGNVIGTTTTASYVQLQNVDGHTEFSQSVATALENTDSFPYTGSAVISGSLTFSSDSNFIPPKGTENQKPSNPEAGTFYYNTDNGNVEVYTGNMWAILNFENVVRVGTAVTNTEVFDGEGKLLIADGGIVSTFTSGGLNYQAHTFLTSDTLEVYNDVTVDYLLVAGGGGGGGRHGGGGGGGGYINANTIISSGSYDIVIGAGGNGGEGTSVQGLNGSNTTFNGLTANGGGGGGAYDGQVGIAGGSGGGGGYNVAGGSSNQPVTSSPIFSYGNSGGSSSGDVVGSGGGGAGQAGGNASTSGGNGGSGRQWVDGLYYSGGGGGSSWNGGVAGNGGVGGGGGGSRSQAADGFGTGGGSAQNTGGDGHIALDDNVPRQTGNGGANTGGGGGAGDQSGYNSYRSIGGNGGSGIVIIRYQV